MKNLLILGAGTAGTMAAARLSKKLNLDQWQITLVDKDPVHYYQPAFLFMPFGWASEGGTRRPKAKYVPRGVKLVMSSIEMIEPERNRVVLGSGETLAYDYLIIATGTDIYPEETPGLGEHEWGRSMHTFYNYDGAKALAEALREFQGGRLVVNVVENPIKCPVAPLEFLFLADYYFNQRGIRDRVELVYATPLPGAFTKPIAAKKLDGMLQSRKITVEPEFYIERADPDAKRIVSYDEREVPYDLLVSVPLNKGAEVIGRSGLGDELNYVRVNKHTFLSERYANIFALGDATNAPTSKAGSVAHFSIDLFGENFLNYVDGKPMEKEFDGHANCFVESGYGKGILIDFNYTQEPLPGTYPAPVVGPFRLLDESRFNHLGKLMFQWIYWNIGLRGLEIPLPSNMSMVGKKVPQAVRN
jgi:sulfide:quinone oxidoreductase